MDSDEHCSNAVSKCLLDTIGLNHDVLRAFPGTRTASLEDLEKTWKGILVKTLFRMEEDGLLETISMKQGAAPGTYVHTSANPPQVKVTTNWIDRIEMLNWAPLPR